VEGRQLVEDVVSCRQARMSKCLAAGDHLEGDAAEAGTDFDASMSWVFAGGPPAVSQDVEVVVATDQVVGDAQDGGAELAIGAAHQGAVGAIHLVALIPGRSEAGAAGDGAGVGVVGDGSHLAGEVGGDRKSTRLNSSHLGISYAVFCLKKKKTQK